MPFTLNNFADAMQQIQKPGGTRGVMRTVLPEHMVADHDKDFRRCLAIIRSMTKDEREYPEQIHPNRARRIAQGSGTDPKDVDDFVRQFLRMRHFLNQMTIHKSGRRSRSNEKPGH